MMLLGMGQGRKVSERWWAGLVGWSCGLAAINHAGATRSY